MRLILLLGIYIKKGSQNINRTIFDEGEITFITKHSGTYEIGEYEYFVGFIQNGENNLRLIKAYEFSMDSSQLHSLNGYVIINLKMIRMQSRIDAGLKKLEDFMKKEIKEKEEDI